MAGLKSLAKDTAIYGLSSIVGRFLNWMLVPIYTHVFPDEEYGIVTLVYSYVALLVVVLTFGMETGFFRFTNHERWKDPNQVYTTTLISIMVVAIAFCVVTCSFAAPIAGMLGGSGVLPCYVWMMAITLGADAVCSIPFAYLRYKKRPYRFALIKLINIGLSIGLNLFFIVLCPYIWETSPEWIMWFYDPDFGVGYVFLSNVITSLLTLVLLYPEVTVAKLRFCGKLFREMFKYSYPLLILGLAGIMNQNLDKILYPQLMGDTPEAMAEVGVYGANYKIAIIMVMFIQAFRFAYEPFIFAQHKKTGSGSDLQAYRDAMKYFVIFGLFIFLGVMFFLDILKYFISSSYFAGLKVVPIIMLAELFFGVFFNLSLWYKLTDRTVWGVWFSLLGLVVTIAGNVIFVPMYGYMACAWSAFACYGVMMLASYFVGKKKYPIGYDIKRMLVYAVIAGVLYAVGMLVIDTGDSALNMALRSLLLIVYCLIVIKIEKINPLALIRRR